MRNLVRAGLFLAAVVVAVGVIVVMGPDVRARLFPPTCIKVAEPAAPGDGSTRIDVWSGERQSFGQNGEPSLYLNVLGNVTDIDGVDTLQYRLNGRDPVAIPIGQDCRRLAEPGDFNVDLRFAEMLPGDNQIEIVAIDGTGERTSANVTVAYEPGQSWPLPYEIDWSDVTDIGRVAQPVDGRWAVEPAGVRTLQVGYDRVLNVGDLSWTDYEATMSMTLHDIDAETGFGWPSNGPAVGFIVRWIGHFPDGDKRPADGFTPLGSLAWYRWIGDVSSGRLVLSDTDGRVAVDKKDESFPVGSTQWIKMRVETLADGHVYSLKMWADGEEEPARWELVNTQPLDGVDSGSLVLVAHHVDVTFGDLSVVPIP